MIAAIMLPVVTSCGGDEEEEVTLEQHVDYVLEENMFDEIFRMFGIDRNDYYDNIQPCGYEDKIVIALIRKSDNKVYVAVYDTLKQATIYTNTDIRLEDSISVPYYENTFEGELTGTFPRYCETENGFIIDVTATYTAKPGSTYSYIFMENLLFFDGSNTVTKQLATTSKPYYEMEKWYGNSCLLRNYAGYTCYTDKGEVIFSDKVLNWNGERIVVSYEEFILFEKAEDRLRIRKHNVQVDPLYSSVWDKEIVYGEPIPSDVRTTISIEDKTTTIWTVSVKFVWENGTTKYLRFSLNIETGEYHIL